MMPVVPGTLARKIIALFLIEKHRKEISGFSLLLVGAFSIAPAPALWALSPSAVYIFMLQLYSGFAWAFVEVGLSLIFFRDLKNEERVPVLTVYNLVNSLAIIFGTFLGGKVLALLGAKLSSYYLVFALGTAARSLAVIPLYRFIRRQRQGTPYPFELRRVSGDS